MNNITKVILTTCCAAFLLQRYTQTINIKAVDNETKELIEDCSCVVTDGSGRSYVVTSNPGTANIHRSQGAVQVNCRKEGYRQINTSVGDSFNATTMVNVLF